MFPLLTKPTCLDGETFTVRFTVVLDCLLSKGEVGTGGDLINPLAIHLLVRTVD